jgi:hypothetical protein
MQASSLYGRLPYCRCRVGRRTDQSRSRRACTGGCQSAALVTGDCFFRRMVSRRSLLTNPTSKPSVATSKVFVSMQMRQRSQLTTRYSQLRRSRPSKRPYCGVSRPGDHPYYHFGITCPKLYFLLDKTINLHTIGPAWVPGLCKYIDLQDFAAH